MSMFVCIHTHNDTPPPIVHEAATAAAAAAAAVAVVLVDRLAGYVLVLAAVLGQLL